MGDEGRRMGRISAGDRRLILKEPAGREGRQGPQPTRKRGRRLLAMVGALAMVAVASGAPAGAATAGRPPAAAPARALRYQTINLPGAIYTAVIGINDKGVLTGDYVPNTTPERPVGYIDAHGHITSFSYPSPAFDTYSEALNNQGTAVGDSERGTGRYEGWLRSPRGRFTPLNDPLAGTGKNQGTVPVSVNDHGVVAGAYLTSRDIVHGFVWRAGRFTTVDVPHAFYHKPGWGSEIFSINNAGVMAGIYTPSRKNVIVGYVESSGHFFSFTGPGGGTRPGDATYAELISNTGAIAGYSGGPSGVQHGWVLSGFRFTPINDPRATIAPSKTGASGTAPTAINRHGVVVGVYWDARHLPHAFLVRTGITGGASLPPPSAPGATGPASAGGGAGLAPAYRIGLLGR